MAQSAYEEVGSRVCAKDEIIEGKKDCVRTTEMHMTGHSEGLNDEKGASSGCFDNCFRQCFLNILSRNTITTQNMYAYHCHNTTHVHVPLSQHKTCTRTTVTTQNMYTYHCHNTKPVHVPIFQYKT
jgi:hypothetical protein